MEKNEVSKRYFITFLDMVKNDYTNFCFSRCKYGIHEKLKMEAKEIL